jgi:AraC family transcriptional regulator
MDFLTSGKYYGDTHSKTHVNGLTITDTVYTHDRVDWHYHEHPYFTFLLEGKLLEGTTKEIHKLCGGDLLFHNWQEAHYNIKPPVFTRGFHLELSGGWLDNYGITLSHMQGSLHITDPNRKLAFYRLFRECKIPDTAAEISIESSLLQFFHDTPVRRNNTWQPPKWVSVVRDYLHTHCCKNLTLAELSSMAGIHPAHLSRDFVLHFNSTLGVYIRRLRVERSVSLLAQRSENLAGISAACGFADQSHYTRCFKEVMGLTPAAYRKMLLKPDKR